jgi:curved DNA-binding protein
MPGRDIEQAVSIHLHEAYTGTTRLITKGGRTIRVNIPAGATDGTRVRLAGEGEPGEGGGAPGNLYLVVKVEPHPQFEREGDDLQVDVRVDMFTAMLGGEIEVPTLSRPVRLKIPAATQSGRKFRLSGKGMPILRQPDHFGDLYARILISVPEQLNDQQRALVEKLRAMF